MAELVDALDSKSSAARRAGSIPAPGTKKYYQLVQKTQKYKNLKGLDENLGLFSYGVSVRGKPGLAFYCDEVAIDVPTSMPNHRHGQNQA